MPLLGGLIRLYRWRGSEGLDDKELISRILEGDELALEALHKRYARQIYHYIYLYGNEEL